MSFGSAGRRFGALQVGVAHREREWVSPATVALCAGFGRCLLAIFVLAALIFCGVALVEILDHALDFIYNLN